jgi:hypothetical protein
LVNCPLKSLATEQARSSRKSAPAGNVWCTTQSRTIWGVRILLEIAFGAAGAVKLAGVPQMVATFEARGVGQCVSGTGHTGALFAATQNGLRGSTNKTQSV